MNFDYSDDQKFLKSEARKFLDARATAKVTRAVLDDASKSYDPELGKAVAESPSAPGRAPVPPAWKLMTLNGMAPGRKASPSAPTATWCFPEAERSSLAPAPRRRVI